MKVTSMVQLRKLITDKRIRISKYINVYYADVVESNGDEHVLTRSHTVQGLYMMLREMGYVSKDV
jgi:transketolase N-terminal domain/subunit